MEWIADPHAWLGLVTLIFLEIVLGIDNLVFIAILAEKLPPHQRNRARLTGLSLALVMRLGLLLIIGWVISLKEIIFSIGEFDFSWRSIILLIGGAFLLAKGTLELHERLEGDSHDKKTNATHAIFWQVIVQIVVLDAVFSLDSIITATGMIPHEQMAVMYIAVIVAMGVMMWGSGPLMQFVNRHPTVVILCLGFLMMIGFSLIVEGLGYHIPKGYLYAAIGFSILIEAFNQIGRRNREKLVSTNDLRERTAGAVLRLLGGGRNEGNLAETVDVIAEQSAASEVFKPEEKQMIRSVLDLAERPVRSIMSPRQEVEWLDVSSSDEEMRKEIPNFRHTRIVLAHEKVDEFVGVALTKDILLSLAEGKKIDWQKAMRQPLVVHENTNVLRLMEQLRRSPIQLAIVVDEHGSFEGVVTPTDILEAIAGDFPDDEEEQMLVERNADNSLVVEGYADIRRLSGFLDCDLVDDNDRYTTLAGYMLWQFGHLPSLGESFDAQGLRFEVIELERRNISKVRISQINNNDADALN
ncbi:TerC family protein [Bartonella sp. HY329]|uniref:TerC family protein n=1 Tax=unclassified Bartonella TaxID=2645622 RepID=UPI0021C7EB6B|nr:MULTISPECIES: TerC family protein [unclassified Bartonella]UXM96179.1 TerC family protein [Bartonella sp. HY329]UXN10503.1 TerC family protein [Bartonella sp. HY328]